MKRFYGIIFAALLLTASANAGDKQPAKHPGTMRTAGAMVRHVGSDIKHVVCHVAHDIWHVAY